VIIQICDTNGSGKTTAARAVIAAGQAIDVVTIAGREMGTLYTLPGVAAPLLVMGKYGEAATGGCDRLHDTKGTYPVMEHQHGLGRHVLFEGIRMTNHTDGLAFYRRVGDLTIILLTTTLEQCFEGLRARRLAAGGPEHKELSTRDIESTVTRNRNYAFKLSQLGARVHRVSREEAPGLVLELLRSAP
jgi:hypothetical protein